MRKLLICLSRNKMTLVKSTRAMNGKQGDEWELSDFAEKTGPKEKEEETEEEEGGRGKHIPLHRWVMHGAVMFGREFCYAMETALVTPILLQIGLPEQYYSLTWFLSPVLGLIFTPVIGSASDRCTLRWGRRRPFILALCVGVLVGVTLFLNGSLIGLSVGDTVGSQPIGIVLTVFGVVVLDFCADAAEGPIISYTLDVADTDEQDMALNVHAFSAGLGGALGYMMGGLDWTGTALGRIFKSQEQVLFVFTAILFIISVSVHMFSISEQQFSSSHQPETSESEESTGQLSSGRAQCALDVIAEEDGSLQERQENSISAPEEEEMEFLTVERVRSKSDSVLAMPDATVKLDPDLDPDLQLFFPNVDPTLLEEHGELDAAFLPNQSFGSASPPCVPESPSCVESALNDQMPELESRHLIRTELGDQIDGSPPLITITSCPEGTVQNTKNQHAKTVNGVHRDQCHQIIGFSSPRHRNRPSSSSLSSRPHRHTFYRQPSFTFSLYGRVGSQRSRLRRLVPGGAQAITSTRSLNDLTDYQQRGHRRELQLSARSLSSESSSSEESTEGGTTVRLLWLSMLKMPSQLWRLCVCHLLTWFSIIAEAVFYTDFMGQVIYHGDPTAPDNSTELMSYSKGVQMGCWGLVVYAATAAVCSAILQKYLDNFDLSIKVIYIVGTLAFSIGTAIMATFPNVYVAMVMVSTMGIISMSISYCPYALLGQYHEIKEYIRHSPENTRRGFGIDCAILTCQVYVSQILVASALGAVVEAVGSVRVIPVVASVGSFLGFLSSCFLVMYPDMEPSTSEQDEDSVRLPAVAEVGTDEEGSHWGN